MIGAVRAGVLLRGYNRVMDGQITIKDRHWIRWVLVVVVLVVLTVIGTVIWRRVLMDRYRSKRLAVVIPGQVYRSGQISIYRIEDDLKRLKIRRIVSLGGYDPNDRQIVKEAEVARKLGITLHYHTLNGWGTGAISDYANALKEIQRARSAGEPVLVHCAAGTNRTGAAIAFYRMLVQGWSADRAMQEMTEYDFDPVANPRLLPYMNRHMKQLTEILVCDGVMDEPAQIPRIEPTHPDSGEQWRMLLRSIF